jgi:hypothetical protein
MTQFLTLHYFSGLEQSDKQRTRRLQIHEYAPMDMAFTPRKDAEHYSSTSRREEVDQRVHNSFGNSTVEHNFYEIVVFYNIYIPRDQGMEGIQNAVRIVREQVPMIIRRLLSASSNARQSLERPMVTIRYTTVGMDGIVANFSNSSESTLATAENVSIMSQLCDPLRYASQDTTYSANTTKLVEKKATIQCIHVGHHDEGYEQHTLQDMYEYCRGQEKGDEQRHGRAVYSSESNAGRDPGLHLGGRGRVVYVVSFPFSKEYRTFADNLSQNIRLLDADAARGTSALKGIVPFKSWNQRGLAAIFDKSRNR